MVFPEGIDIDLVHAERHGTLIAAVISSELKQERGELGAALAELHNSGQIFLTSDSNLNAIQILEHSDFWLAIHPLTDAIPSLIAPHREILAYVNALVRRAGSDMAAGMPNIALKEWSQKNPDEASKVIELIIDCEPLALEHGVYVVLGLANQQLPFELIANAAIEVRTLGVRSLGKMEHLGSDALKSGIDEAFQVLKNDTDNKIRIAAIETAFQLWEKAPSGKRHKQTDLINLVGQRGNAPELTTLAAMLFYHDKGLLKSDIELILEWLSVKPSVAGATLRHLDMAIRLKDERWNFRKAVQTIEFCLPLLDKPAEADDFRGFCEWLWSDPRHVSYLFSRWLLNGQQELCGFLNEILQIPSGRGVVDIQRSELPPASHDQIFMSEKCIGYLWNHEVVVASILLSIIRNGTTKARAHTEELLFSPMLLSFGGKLRDYLEEQSSNKSSRIAKCIGRLLNKHDTYLANIKQVEEVVELRPTIEQRRAAAVKERDWNRNVQKNAHRRSLLTDLVTRQTLLYGHKSLSFIHDSNGKQYPHITTLMEHSYSFEIPQLSVINPVGFKQLLIIFRSK